MQLSLGPGPTKPRAFGGASGGGVSTPFLPTQDLNLAEWFHVSDLADGPVTSWPSRKFVGALTEVTNPPTKAGGYVTFDGVASKLSKSKVSDVFVGALGLPDATNSNPGKGFTITGMIRLSDGSFLCAYHGVSIVNVDTNWASSIIHVSSTGEKLGEVLTATAWDASVHSIQGIALRLSDNMLFVNDLDNNRILRGTLTINPNGSISIAATTAFALGYSPTGGLAHRASTDQLFVLQDGVALIDVLNANTGVRATTGSSGLGQTLRDQCWIDDAAGILWYGAGANGATYNVFIWRILDDFSGAIDFTDSLAGEGIAVDLVLKKAWIANDAWGHQVGNLQNEIREYNIVMPYASVTDIFGVLKLNAGVGTGAIADVIWANGIPTASNSFGVYAASATQLNVIVNTSAAATTEQVIAQFSGLADMTLGDNIFYVRIDLANDLVSLWMNGADAPVTAVCALPNDPLFSTRIFCMGAANAGETSAALRFCPMSVKSLGQCIGAGQQRKIEGSIAWLTANQGLLSVNHPYKNAAP